MATRSNPCIAYSAQGIQQFESKWCISHNNSPAQCACLTNKGSSGEAFRSSAIGFTWLPVRLVRLLPNLCAQPLPLWQPGMPRGHRLGTWQPGPMIWQQDLQARLQQIRKEDQWTRQQQCGITWLLWDCRSLWAWCHAHQCRPQNWTQQQHFQRAVLTIVGGARRIEQMPSHVSI